MTCLCGKRRYPNQAVAEQVVLAARIARALRRSTRRREQRAYPCPRSTAWHVTSQPQRTERGAK